MTGVGCQALLDVPMTAFFASRQCPGTAIRAATDWALAQAKVKQAVIGGFHSPLEQSVLTLLLQARSPVVLVLARPIAGARLSRACVHAIGDGIMAVVSTTKNSRRLTREEAAQRNDVVTQLASRVVIAYASVDGDLYGQAQAWTKEGKLVARLVD